MDKFDKVVDVIRNSHKVQLRDMATRLKGVCKELIIHKMNEMRVVIEDKTK